MSAYALPPTHTLGLTPGCLNKNYCTSTVLLIKRSSNQVDNLYGAIILMRWTLVYLVTPLLRDTEDAISERDKVVNHSNTLCKWSFLVFNALRLDSNILLVTWYQMIMITQGKANTSIGLKQ